MTQKIKYRRCKAFVIAVSVLLILCGLSGCEEVTADHVLQETKTVDYENMTFAEILTASIGCSEDTSNEIAEVMYASGILEITGIESNGIHLQRRG